MPRFVRLAGAEQRAATAPSSPGRTSSERPASPENPLAFAQASAAAIEPGLLETILGHEMDRASERGFFSHQFERHVQFPSSAGAGEPGSLNHPLGLTEYFSGWAMARKAAQNEWRPGADVDQPLDERNGKKTAVGSDFRADAGSQRRRLRHEQDDHGIDQSRHPARRSSRCPPANSHSAAASLGKAYAAEPERQGHRAALRARCCR